MVNTSYFVHEMARQFTGWNLQIFSGSFSNHVIFKLSLAHGTVAVLGSWYTWHTRFVAFLAHRIRGILWHKHLWLEGSKD